MSGVPRIKVSREGKLWWVRFSREFVYYDAAEFSTKSAAVNFAKRWARQALREALQEGVASDWQRHLMRGFPVVVDGAEQYFCSARGRGAVCSRRQ